MVVELREKNKRKVQKDASDSGGVFFCVKNFSNSHDFHGEKGIMEVTRCHLRIGDSNKASVGAYYEEMRLW